LEEGRNCREINAGDGIKVIGSGNNGPLGGGQNGVAVA